MKQFLNVFLFIALSFTGLGQDYSVTTANRPWTSPATALKQIPKKAQVAGQIVKVKDGDNVLRYRFDGKGNLVLQDGQDIYTAAVQQAVGKAEAEIAELKSRVLTIEEFRDAGESDDDVWDQAIEAAQKQRRQLTQTNRYYVFYRTHIIFQTYIDWKFEGVTVANGMKENFDANLKPILTYPTLTDVGPMVGSAFYFTNSSYGDRIEGLRLQLFRFGYTYFTQCNGAEITNCSFENVCVGVFFYQGAQNPHITDCSGGVGCVFAAAATCFPADHPNAYGDNIFSDGVDIGFKGASKEFQIVKIPSFDYFFRESILRPKTPSYSSTTFGYVYRYSDTSDYCNITGWVDFEPGRIPRDQHGRIVRGVDVRGDLARGIGLFNCAQNGMNIIGPLQIELKDEAINKFSQSGKALFVVGSVINGHVEVPGYPAKSANLLHYTGEAYSEGYAEQWNKIGFSYPWHTGLYFLDRVINETVNTGYITGYIGVDNEGTTTFGSRGSYSNSTITGMEGGTLYVDGFPGQSLPLSEFTNFRRGYNPDSRLIGFNQINPVSDGSIRDTKAIQGHAAVIMFQDYASYPPNLAAVDYIFKDYTTKEIQQKPIYPGRLYFNNEIQRQQMLTGPSFKYSSIPLMEDIVPTVLDYISKIPIANSDEEAAKYGVQVGLWYSTKDGFIKRRLK